MERWDNEALNFEIHAIDRDGTNERNLTREAAHDRLPSWVGDGGRVLFYSNRDGNDEVYIMGADGSEPTNLTRNDACDYGPGASPDGQRVMFHSNRDGRFRTYVMNIDGSDVRPIEGFGEADHLQDWSPVGSNSKSTPFAAVRSGASCWIDNHHVVLTSVTGDFKQLLMVNIDSGDREALLQSQGDDWLPAVHVD